MANPVRAARKEGRAMVKGVKQGIKAEKITKKFQAKADKLSMKAGSAEKAKAPSEPMAKMETRKAPLLETKKAELAKFTPMKPMAAPAKKSSSKKSTKKSTSSVGPLKGDYKTDAKKDTSDRTRGIPKIPGTPVTGTGKPFFKDDFAYRKEQNKRALAQLNERRKKKGLAPLGEDYLPIKAKAMGGVAKPSYKKGGYMMNTKKKKK
jgi:uncharacterized protein YkwD